jgi:hypothetical protein
LTEWFEQEVLGQTISQVSTIELDLEHCAVIIWFHLFAPLASNFSAIVCCIVFLRMPNVGAIAC